MSDELVERLLDWPYQGETMAHEAADSIKQLVATNEQLTAELSACTESPGGCGYWRERSKALTAERETLEQDNHRWKMECENFWRDREKALTAERDKYESAWMTAEGKLEDAVQGLQKCQAELDEYSRQEYPLDHSVHERYRQRDYNANPARITLVALKGESHE